MNLSILQFVLIEHFRTTELYNNQFLNLAATKMIARQRRIIKKDIEF